MQTCACAMHIYTYADQLDYKEDCTALSSLTATNAIDVFITIAHIAVTIIITIIIIIIIMADVRGCVCLP